MKTICFFGIYNTEVPRNKIYIKGLRANGFRVIECNATRGKVKKYIDLTRLFWKIRKEVDVIFVGYPAGKSVLLAKMLTRKPIVFDAFMSMYDSIVWDRKEVKPRTPRALYYWLLDYISCALADAVLLDTNAHIDYFVKTFKLKRKKFFRVYVGSDEEEIVRVPATLPHEPFIVHFHGTHIPLQGIEYIVRAAKILEKENIIFNLIGSGQTYEDVRALADTLHVSNVKFIPKIPYRDLGRAMGAAHVSLGVFGDTAKTQRVIPNKVFEALLVGSPVITADTPAARELLEDRKTALLCRAADPADLAEKILVLKKDEALRKTLGENGRALFLHECTPFNLGAQIKIIIDDVLAGR